MIPAPGDYFCLRRYRMPILVIMRHNDGALRTFVFICSHRGAPLNGNVLPGKPPCSCPYHGWTYDLDGAGRRALRQGASTQTALPQMKPPQVEERDGMIFAAPNPDRRFGC